MEEVAHIPGEYNPSVMDDLAVDVCALYGKNPYLTLNIIASQLDAHIHDVTYVVDAYECIEDEDPVHRGPGKGGNWLPPENQVSMEPLPIEEIGDDTGKVRWPDGSLRDRPFDIHEENDRTEMGISEKLYDKLLIAQADTQAQIEEVQAEEVKPKEVKP
jgi:hypothetical protein